MDVNERITAALVNSLGAEYVRLDVNGGISGFVVSRRFKGVPALDRQRQIETALESASLSRDEARRVLMIAGVTPEEYESVGSRIRVLKVKQMAGAVEVLLHGSPADADYVRASLGKAGIDAMEPKHAPGAAVILKFRAKWHGGGSLTKEDAIQVLKRDRYIDVVSSA